MNQDAGLGNRFDRLRRQSLAAGAAGLVLCAVGAVWDPQQFYQSYLVAYVFWTGIALGCLALAMLHQLVHGTWGLATSRLFEAGIATLTLALVLFLPVVYGMKHLYPWAQYDVEQAKELLGHRAMYLNVPAFLYRSLGYFAVWIVLGLLLNRWSLKRDREPSDRLTLKIRRLSAGGLVLFGLTATFAAVDWIMSLEMNWYSTIYGALVAMGGVLAAFAFVITVLALIADRPPLAEVATPKVFNDLGSLLLAFVILWAYLAFSQYLVTWSGNTLEEITWYLRRLRHGWQWLALLVVVFHFALPFLLLLSKQRKRNRFAMFRVACGLLCADYVNVFWMIAPAYRYDAARSGASASMPLTVHWLDLAVPVAMSGIWIWVFLGIVARKPLLPVNDPAWENVATRDEESSRE